MGTSRCPPDLPRRRPLAPHRVDRAQLTTSTLSPKTVGRASASVKSENSYNCGQCRGHLGNVPCFCAALTNHRASSLAASLCLFRRTWHVDWLLLGVVATAVVLRQSSSWPASMKTLALMIRCLLPRRRGTLLNRYTALENSQWIL